MNRAEILSEVLRALVALDPPSPAEARENGLPVADSGAAESPRMLSAFYTGVAQDILERLANRLNGQKGA